MVGAALVRRLASEQCRILTVDRTVVDLTSQTDTEHWIAEAKPDAVILAAGKVGGIAYNNAYPVDFLADNLAMALNVIRASHRAGAHSRCSERSPAYMAYIVMYRVAARRIGADLIDYRGALRASGALHLCLSSRVDRA
jgi:hypothetical protein